MMSGISERRCRARTRAMAVVAVGAVVVWPAVVLAQAGHVGQGPIQPSSGAGHVGANPTTITTSPMPPSQPAVPPSTPPKPLPPIKRPIIIFYNGHYWWYPVRERTEIIGTQQIVDPFVMPSVPAPSDLPQPPPVAPEPVKPLTPMEQAVLELSLGQWDRAIQVLESVLVESPRDARAMRLVSRALMGKSQMREAAAMMMAAYDLAPSLAMEPLPPAVVEGFADLRSRFVRFAEMDRSASAWLTCFVLVQAESGPAEAKARALRNYLDRAERSGLDARIGDALRKALGPVPSVRVATPTPVRVPSRSIRPEAEAPEASPSPQGNSPTPGGA